MKISNNVDFIRNPVLYYKLDPGEPGLAAPSFASSSIANVALHEATNIRRFESDAAENGGIVVFSFIGLNLQFKGSFLAATSGRSEALIVYPVKEDNNNNKFYLPNDKVKTSKGIDESKKIEDENNLNKEVKDKKQDSSAIDEKKAVKIDREIDELKVEKRNLENQIKGVDFVNNENAKSPFLENRIDEINRKIKYLEIQKEVEKQKEFLIDMSKMKNNITLKLIGMNFGNLSQQNNIGNFIDTTA